MRHGNENGALRYRRVIFLVLSLTYLLVFFHRQAPAVLALDLMTTLHLDGASLGLMGAAFFYPYALLQIPAGAITARLGGRWTLCLFFALAALGSIGFSFATTLSSALFFRVLVGAGVGMVLVPILELLSTWFRRSELSVMLGLLIATGGMGIYAGAAPLGYLDGLIGWRGCFQVAGGVSLLCVGCLWLFVRDKPQDMGYPPIEKPVEELDEEAGGVHEGYMAQAVHVLTSFVFWPLAVWAFLVIGIFVSFGGLWGGPYLIHVHGLSKVDAGHVLSMLALGLIAGGPLLGYLAEHVFGSCKVMLVIVSVILAGLTGMMVYGLEGVGLIGLSVWFGLLGLTTMAAAPLALALGREMFSPSLAGLTSGLVNFFFLLGGAVMQQVSGWLLDLRGYSADGGHGGHYEFLFIAYFICSLVALGGALCVRERR